jgi:hypothetical protein
MNPWLRDPAGARPAYISSLITAAAVTLASVLGVARAADGLYDTSESVLVSRGADVANLVVVVPVLLLTMWRAWRGSLTGLLLWLGTAFYVVYAYLPYLIGAPFTPLVFAYVVVFLGAALTLIWLATAVDAGRVREELVGAPARAIGAILAVIAILAYAGLTATAVDALGSSITEAAWRGHWVADWTLGTPVLLLGGVLLWRRTAFGYVLAPALLLVSGLGGVAFAAAALVNNVAGDLRTEGSVIVVHLVIGAASFVVLVWFLHFAARRTRGTPLPDARDRGAGLPVPPSHA